MNKKLIGLVVGVAVVGLVLLGLIDIAVGVLGGKILLDHFLGE